MNKNNITCISITKYVTNVMWHTDTKRYITKSCMKADFKSQLQELVCVLTKKC